VKRSFFYDEISFKTKKYHKTLINVSNFSVLPFVLDFSREAQVFLIVDDMFFDDCFSCFPISPSTVGIPLFSNYQNNYFETYHEKTFRESYSKISTTFKKIKTFVVSKSIFEKKLFSNKENIVLDFSEKIPLYEDLLSFLEEKGYKKKKLLEKTGDYVVRGFVVDVFSFGEKKPYRINYFNEEPTNYLLDPDSLLTVSETKNCIIRPFLEDQTVSLSELNNKSIFVCSYKKGELVVVNNSIKSGSSYIDGSFRSLEYNDFKKVSTKETFSSSLLLSSGVTFNNNTVVPLWFYKTKKTALKNTPIKKPLEVGFFYVHEDFGVCVFLGFEEKTTNQDRLCLRFSDGVLKVDIKFMNKISFFSEPQKNIILDSLHKQKKWKNKVKKASKSAEEYVGNIVENYVVRSKIDKKRLKYDEDLFSLFMGGFKYKDTNDQSLSWQNVLEDLLSSSPMDRLICGDVGFGKTEIAIRAAFLAVSNGLSVIVLAPTTILVQQLYECFDERVSPFGVVTRSLSRFSENKNKTIDFFLNGSVDILIGTHSVCRKTSILKKVGLFVVDEEHRFGVEDKERVFSVNPHVDYLSMSATPIPRSLQFSLSGIRDISVMLSPPKSRKPIITHILKYSFNFLEQVVFKEISRDGRVFIVENSVNKVKNLTRKLLEVFPQFNTVCLYGSMDKKTIKKNMEDFKSGNIDVLVSTSIIGSGIDIPQANSVVVLNSHLFGLSQLYQIKGRVGRGDIQGYAYFMYPELEQITSNGKKRLSSLQINQNLGDGYNVALADLNIRGPGFLFGFSQSGCSLVGFDHYTKLINKATSILFPENGKISPESLPFVSLGEEYIPKKYIENDRDRVFSYDFISSCVDLDSLNEFVELTVIKFGPIPFSFLNLINSRKISLSVVGFGIKSISFDNNLVVFQGLKIKGNLEDFLQKINLFFLENETKYSFLDIEEGYKFHFKHKVKDVYILVKNLVEKIYV